MKLTDTYSRVATIPMRMDVGDLREHLAHELHQWKIGVGKSPGAVRSFWVQVKHLARMIGKTSEEVYQELQQDAAMMEDEEEKGLGHDRFSAKGKAVNPWAVCHSTLGPEKGEKFERCVQDVKKKHKIKKD